MKFLDCSELNEAARLLRAMADSGRARLPVAGQENTLPPFDRAKLQVGQRFEKGDAGDGERDRAEARPAPQPSAVTKGLPSIKFSPPVVPEPARFNALPRKGQAEGRAPGRPQPPVPQAQPSFKGQLTATEAPPAPAASPPREENLPPQPAPEPAQRWEDMLRRHCGMADFRGALMADQDGVVLAEYNGPFDRQLGLACSTALGNTLDQAVSSWSQGEATGMSIVISDTEQVIYRKVRTRNRLFYLLIFGNTDNDAYEAIDSLMLEIQSFDEE